MLKDGNFKENENLESQLIEKYEKVPEKVYLKPVSRNEKIERAYRLRGKNIAFSLEK